MITENSLVSGTDFKGNLISGKVENIVKLANVAIVRVGEDRTHLIECYIDNLEETTK